MKKVLFYTIAILFGLICSHATSDAQIVGGEGGTIKKSSKDNSENFQNNQFYLTLGTASPMGELKDRPINVKTGGSLEMGNVFYIKKLNAKLDKIGVGIDWTIMEFTAGAWETPNGYNNAILMGEGKLGPLVSVNLAEGFNIDAYFKIGSGFYFDMDNIGRSTRKSIGANLRYNALKINFNYSFGNVRNITEFDPLYPPDGYFTEIKAGYFQFRLGFSL